MANEKRCYDCVFCITDNSPIEVGLQYVCFLQKGDRIDQWNTPCKYFVEGKEDGK